MSFKKKGPGKLARKLVVTIVLFSLIVTLIITSIQLFLEYRKDINQIHSTIRMVETSYVPSLVNSLWEINDTQVDIILKGILSLPGMEYIEIRKNGESHTSLGALTSRHIIDRELPLAIQLRHKRLQLGVLRVVNSLDRVYEQLIDDALAIFIGNAMKTFFVSIFVFIFIQLTVTRRLMKIAEFTEELDFEELGNALILGRSKIGGMGADEIDQIATAMNLMQKRLKKEFLERNQVETEISESRERFKKLFSRAPVPLWEEDFTEVFNGFNELQSEGVTDFRAYFDDNPSRVQWFARKVLIKDVNHETLKLHEAASKEELMGSLDKIFTENSLIGFKEELISLSSGAKEFEIEGEVGTLNNKTKHVLLKLALDHNKSGGKVTALLSTIDISKRKAAEKENRRLQAELIQSHKMESVGTLAGGIAHEFNNILSIIIGNNEMIMEDLPKYSIARENSDEIRIASYRARDIVKQLLTFSRKDHSSKTAIDIKSVVEETLNLIKSTTPANIEIRTEVPETCFPVYGDATQINQVLINLCNNAMDALPVSGGWIEVGIENAAIKGSHPPVPPGNYVRLWVRDNGSGMNSATLERVFEPYFSTKDVGEGTGIGLAVVHGIVKSHGGIINCESCEGEGTAFMMLIPAYEGPLDEESELDMNFPGKGERILYVDDEPSIAKLGKRHLESFGYHVVATTRPTDALNLVKDQPERFDLVISDMAMPEMPGDQLVTEILNINPEILAVICTGYSSRMSEAKAAELGVKAFLMKPLDRTELARTVREVLDNFRT
ncbi:MAG: response regulator [Desulfobacterales bacterium]|nr:response regulator [Desulfobacterales bacterium]